MKRILIAVIITVLNLANVSCATAMESAPPAKMDLAIMAVFNETNYRNPAVDATIIKGTNSYMKLEINGDSKLIQQVKTLFEKDMRRESASIVERWSGGEHRYIVSFIMPDGTSVSMSLEENESGSATVWVSY